MTLAEALDLKTMASRCEGMDAFPNGSENYFCVRVCGSSRGSSNQFIRCEDSRGWIEASREGKASSIFSVQARGICLTEPLSIRNSRVSMQIT
jgi:hypothetical protein